jgi:uncharacterized peroxidase-related enzyme
MARIKALRSDEASPKSKALLEGVQKGLGMTPNLMATIAHSPAALGGYLGFGQALGSGTLSASLREQIAVAVAGENSCGYCASAHTLLGKGAGVEASELASNLGGQSSDERTQAALDFALAIVTKRGWVSDADLAAVRGAGFSEGDLVEIVAAVAVNVFTNYFNHVADTDIDFPEVAVREPVGV